MTFFKRLFYRFFRPERPPPPERGFAIDTQLQASLEDLAKRERRPLGAIANDLLQQALGDRADAEARLQPWWDLTPRQQEVAALVCLGRTNQEIAERLSIAPETAKSHVRAVLQRFEVHSKVELRHRLAGWDFSAWR
jgi:DNA-binding CsgD family transcriptional regulator